MQATESYMAFDDAPNENYKKFFSKFKEIDIINIQEYKPVHLISYFCKKYFEKFNTKYQFKFNTPTASKSFELFQIKKIGSLLSNDPIILTQYIDWVFETKVPLNKKRFTSISHLSKEEYTQEYKKMILTGNPFTEEKIFRSTILPKNFSDCFINSSQTVLTYGDLAFLNMIPAHERDQFIIDSFNQLKKLNFNFDLLGKIV